VTDAERIWQENSDEALIEAAAELSSYTDEGQRIIRAELKRRGFEDPVEQARRVPEDAGAGADEEDAGAEPEEAEPDTESGDAAPRGPECLRCGSTLVSLGEKRFQTGRKWGILGDAGHLFEGSDAFRVFVCPGCGHVDFFVDPADLE